MLLSATSNGVGVNVRLIWEWMDRLCKGLSIPRNQGIYKVISDTVEFRHSYLSIPAPSTEDRIIHGLQVVAGALTGASPPTSISQVEAITNLRDIFESWRLLAPPSFQPPRISMPGRPRVPSHDPPRVVLPSPSTPAHPAVANPPWSPPPSPAGSTFLSPTPVQASFQATP